MDPSLALRTTQLTVSRRSPLTCMATHSFLSLVCLGAEDGVVEVWDSDTGVLVVSLHGHTEAIWSVALDRTGRRLASGSADNTIRLWDLDSGTCVRTLVGHEDTVHCLLWAPSGSLLATGSDDTTVRVWDTDSGALLHTCQGHSDWIYALASHPTEDLFASGSLDHTVCLWRWSSDALVGTLRHDGHVCSLAATNEWLLSGSFDKTVRVWSWAAQTCVRRLEFDSPISLIPGPEHATSWHVVTRDENLSAGPSIVWALSRMSHHPTGWICEREGKIGAPFSLLTTITREGAVVCCPVHDPTCVLIVV